MDGAKVMARPKDRRIQVVVILGHKWKARLLKGKWPYHEQDLAIALPDKKEIHFRSMSYETVVHELTHAYVEEICIGAVKLGSDQLEEIMCELFAKHGSVILKQAKELLR